MFLKNFVARVFLVFTLSISSLTWADAQAGATTNKRVVFVGADSACTNSSLSPFRIWTTQVANWNNWNDVSGRCFSGSFFQYPTVTSIGQYADSVAKLDPDIVVISAGANYENLRSGLKFENAYPIQQELENYRRLLPQAKLVVVGAWSVSTIPTTLTKKVNATIVRAAKRVDAYYINSLKSNKFLAKFAKPNPARLNFVGQTQLALIVQNSLPKNLQSSRKWALFIGDSYTFGAGASTPSKRWSTLVANEFNVNEINFGIGGAGYLRSGKNFCGQPTCPNYDALIPDLKLVKPDYVFVAGGQNDLEIYSKNRWAAGQLINKTFTDLKSEFPQATIFTVGPSYPSGNPAKGTAMAGMNDFITEAANAISSTRIPLLFPSVLTPEMLASDKVHPNDLGHQAIADKVLSVIKPN